MSEAELDRRVAVMLDAAKAAGELTLRYFQRADLAVEWKPDHSEVTIADREAETLIRTLIEKHFPHDAILGEEHGESAGRGDAGRGASGYRWIIDPIDGTTSFSHGVPLYSTLIGLYRGDDSLPSSRTNVAGVIAMPALGERVVAVAGRGATWQRAGKPDAPARVSSCTNLADALLSTTSITYYQQTNRIAAHDRLARAVKRVRGFPDAYGFALAATGRVDIAIDPLMKPWDNGPFPVIFAEAGGVFTDWRGADTHAGGDGVAGNRTLHAAVCGLL